MDINKENSTDEKVINNEANSDIVNLAEKQNKVDPPSESFDKAEFRAKFHAVLKKNRLFALIEDDIEGKTDKFYFLANRLVECNKKFNLTAILDLDGIVLKHFADSMTLSMHIKEGDSMLDVGCGGGFPSLPMAIIRPDITIYAIDSTEKKIIYVNETAKLLGLKNLKAHVMRAEEGGRHPLYRESFDKVSARALADMQVLSEYCLPFVKIGGKFIAMKAIPKDDEINSAKEAVKQLGGGRIMTNTFTLLSENEEEKLIRNMLVVEKKSPTPRIFPRKHSTIVKKPLK